MLVRAPSGDRGRRRIEGDGADSDAGDAPGGVARAAGFRRDARAVISRARGSRGTRALREPGAGPDRNATLPVVRVEGEHGLLCDREKLTAVRYPTTGSSGNWHGLRSKPSGRRPSPARSNCSRRSAGPAPRRPDADLAEYLVASLDDHGFLRGGAGQVATDIWESTWRGWSRSLGLIRSVGPPATGARDVRESLLLQIDARCAPSPLRELARALADQYLEPLGRGRLGVIAAALGGPEDQVTGSSPVHPSASPVSGARPARAADSDQGARRP